jgi:hypothetical protein
MKKNKTEHKRFISIQMDVKNYIEFDGLGMDLISQKIYGLKDGGYCQLLGATKLEYKRERKNKPPKILHASSSATSDTYIDSNHQLFSYSHLIAIDTNTNYLNGSSVSITAAFHIIPGFKEINLVRCNAKVLALLEFWNVVEKPENLGWWVILQALQDHPDFFKGKIGLIVDSDLENHSAFNLRERPIYRDFYLPENVTIIYASDNGGSEHLSTKMIRYCHNLASDLFKEKNLIMNIENLHIGLDGIYSHIRQWNPDHMEIRPFCN